MSLNLLNSYGIKGVNYGLYAKSADVTDTEYLSRYFVVSELNPVFTAGKNAIAFNGSSYLKPGTEIFVECLDSQGNALHIELAKAADNISSKTQAYKEASSFVFSIYVFGDTYDGVGHLTLWGTLLDGRSVKWTQNVTINKSQKNSSKVRFYETPKMEVGTGVLPVLSSSVSVGIIDNITLTGTIEGYASNPKKDTNLATINTGNTNIDYRLTFINPVITNDTPDIQSFNSQLVNSVITLNINRIQLPLTTQEADVSQTMSYTVTGVLNNHTLQIDTPYYYNDLYNNNTITNIVNADFSISYPYINYNTSSEHQIVTINGLDYKVKDSFADVTYRGIRTFSGYVARHKVYRKSLLANNDYSVIADEPIVTNEVLIDDITQNKFYDLLGKFYNQIHINNYWFPTTNISLSYSPFLAADTVLLSSPSYDFLTGDDYIMVKNDSVDSHRDPIYVPYDAYYVNLETGSAYDSNFMGLKANVQYIIEVSTTILKDPLERNAQLGFYYTSSMPVVQQENGWTPQHGIQVLNITASQIGPIFNVDNYVTFFTPKSDMWGTLVVVPYLCNAYIKNISFRVYGDDGYSPDVYTTRIPWPISVPNETYKIRAELFDINNNLVYPDITTIQSFDEQGESLIPNMPSAVSTASIDSGSFNTLGVNGLLTVGGDVQVGGEIFNPNLQMRGDITQSRILSVRSDGAIVWDPLVDVTFDDQYLYVTLDGVPDRTDTNPATKQSIASNYNQFGGRKIYWVGNTKHVETNP